MQLVLMPSRSLCSTKPDCQLSEHNLLWPALPTDYMATERPSTAPPRVMNEARRYYQQCQTANNDLYNYRHSGGICPPDYKVGPCAHMVHDLVKGGNHVVEVSRCIAGADHGQDA